MKPVFTFLFAIQIFMPAFSQITINASDMPVPCAFPVISKDYQVDDIISVAPKPNPGVNGNWNYGSYFGNSPSTVTYFSEADTAFTNKGADIFISSFKSLTSSLGYSIFTELDFNANGIEDIINDIPSQHYSLGALTGNNADSLIVPAQQDVYNGPRKLISFPFTYLSNWSSISHRKTTFNLTITAAGLIKTPLVQKYDVIRKDSIIGWGKMQVYTAAGPSVAYDVLVEKVNQSAIDSFFIAGNPAPGALLAAFGMSQGQVTDGNNAYNFYRKGSFIYLMRSFFGSDNFNSPSHIYVNTDNLATGNKDIHEISFTTVLFPNPSNHQELNLVVSNKDLVLKNYIITDLSGRIVQDGPVNMQNGLVHLALNSKLVNGNYFLRMYDDKNSAIISEQFMYQR